MRWRRVARVGVPTVCVAAATGPWLRLRYRAGAVAGLVFFWAVVYLRYRRDALRRTADEFERFGRTDREAFWRHYNELVPTVEQEYELWGPYHTHRHEMRYDLVAAAVRDELPAGGRLLDLGCGSANVADRLREVSGGYVGMDFGHPQIAYAARKHAASQHQLSVRLVRGDGERLPFADGSFDLVIMSEVIEHLIRPEVAVWEVARVLRPRGALVMTTNNASEAPLHSPLSHLLVWFEKALGADLPALISYRPWVWPHRVDPRVLPPGSPDVYLPHTHHIAAETRRLFAAAGLESLRWTTFEFPPPQSATAAWLARRGALGLRLVDALEACARRIPLVRRLGTHLFIVARKIRDPVAPRPPAGVWPGPLSGGSEELVGRRS